MEFDLMYLSFCLKKVLLELLDTLPVAFKASALKVVARKVLWYSESCSERCTRLTPSN